MNEQQKKMLNRALPVLQKEGVLSGASKYINPKRKPDKPKQKPTKKGFWYNVFN